MNRIKLIAKKEKSRHCLQRKYECKSRDNRDDERDEENIDDKDKDVDGIHRWLQAVCYYYKRYYK